MQLRWLFTGDDKQGFTCPQARADAILYRIVAITGYTEDDLERCSAEFIARILRADGPYQEAKNVLTERAMAKR